MVLRGDVVTRARTSFSSARPITIISYHAVAVEPHRFAVTPPTFARHVALIKRHYAVGRLSELDTLLSPATSRRTVILTFDDAYRDFLLHAYPILVAAAVPCTMFVPTGHIGGCNEWDLPGGRAPRREIMTDIELRELHRGGLVDFGSHTVDHVRMTTLPLDAMRHQLRESKSRLERTLSAPVTMFAYPYGMPGDFSRDTARLLSETGYQTAVTSHWGTFNSARTRLTLRRISLAEADSDETIRQKVDGLRDWIGSKETLAHGLRRLGLRQYHH